MIQQVLQPLILEIPKSAHELTAKDCIDIADVAHLNRRYVRMKEWLDEAKRIVNDPNESYRVGEASNLLVNEYLAWTSYLVYCLYFLIFIFNINGIYNIACILLFLFLILKL